MANRARRPTAIAAVNGPNFRYLSDIEILPLLQLAFQLVAGQGEAMKLGGFI